MLFMGSPEETTVLLRRVSSGDREAENELIPHIYQDLRRLAAGYLRRERSDHTLQPTALVHEAYLRLIGSQGVAFQDRSHFFRLAANAMRRILVDHARNRKAGKRGGGAIRIPLEDFLISSDELSDQILQVDAALTRLAAVDQRQAKIVEMRFFAGLSEEEISAALDISTRTVDRDWAMAKAWLYGELSR